MPDFTIPNMDLGGIVKSGIGHLKTENFPNQWCEEVTACLDPSLAG
jgi:hypothetical protein